MARRARLVLVLAVLLVACSDDAPPTFTDAALDAAAIDGAVTDAPVPDAPVPDATPDAAPDAPVDAPTDGDVTGACDLPLVCPAPSPGKLNVCGRLFDVATGAPLGSDAMAGACDLGTPAADGVCALGLRFYEALDYAQNPGGSVPLIPTSLELDGCGRYRAIGLNRTTFGFLGIVVDDAVGVTDRHRTTAHTIANSRAEPAQGLALFALTQATDAAWSMTAGLTGDTFAQRGAVLARFRYQGAPRAGVALQRNGAAIPADDHYFADTTAQLTTVAPAQATTGANGAALAINSTSLVNHGGAGAEPGTCVWPQALAVSIPGVVLMAPFDAATTDGAPCP